MAQPTQQVCQDGTANNSVPAVDEPEELGNKATEPVFHAGLEGIIAVAAALDTNGDPHSISDTLLRFSFSFPHIQCPRQGLNSVTAHVKNWEFPYCD